jgi:hypothetical protein
MIDYNQFSKRMSVILGLLFLLLGISGFGFSVLIYMTEVKPPNSTLHMEKTLTECLDIAKSKSAYSGNIDLRAKQIKIQKYGLLDGKTELFETLNIIKRCNNVVIQEFCVGLMNTDKPKHGCEITGVHVILKYQNPWNK